MGLSELAVRAVRRIVTRSEAQELWDETEYANQFHAAVKDLQARVTL